MSYSDNYPNGTKSGYDSWNDPDRKDYSPYGAERARREAGSGIRKESEVDKYWENQRKRQEESETKRWQEIDDRRKTNARRDSEFEVAKIIKNEKLQAFNKQSWFKKFVAKCKGNDPYSRQSEIYDKAVEQVRSMSDSELEAIIINGRTK